MCYKTYIFMIPHKEFENFSSTLKEQSTFDLDVKVSLLPH